VLWYDSTMKTATVRDLLNHFSRLFAWIAAGITLTQRGKPVARLSPAPTSAGLEKVDWNQSAAMARDRSREIRLSACESSELLTEAGGKW
jgi:antitoxin (DNA-binding transcriptional repressor) of toxin-antitoxin stability system